MTSRARMEESEPISPELVLVSSPELAQAVREQLSDPTPAGAMPKADEDAELTRAARGQPPTPAPAVAKSESNELDREERAEDAAAAPTLDELDIETLERRLARRAELAQAVREQLSSPAPAVAKPERDEQSDAAESDSAPRPMPPPYPRPDIAQPEPEPRRRRSRKVAFVVALATLAAVGAGAAFAWDHFRSTPKGTQAPALPPSEAQVTTGAKPQSAAGLGAFVPGRTWVWSTSKGARAYLVRFFFNGRQVLKRRPTKNQLTLPRSFRYAAGRYRWSVRPITGPPSRPSYGHPIVDSKFVLTGPAAARANSSTP
jgi:hypothetical protein